MGAANDFARIDKEESQAVRKLIDRLPPRERIAFLLWCCEQVSRPGNQIIVTSSTGETWEVYGDWINLCAHLGLNWRRARDELEQRVRRHGTPLFWRPQLCRLLP